MNDSVIASGFDAMGKPIPQRRRQAAYDACKEIGVENIAAFDVVSLMANYLERDKPFNAFEVGLRVMDLTGVYRITAVLLTA